MHIPKFRLFNTTTKEIFVPAPATKDGYKTWMNVDSEGRLMIITYHLMTNATSVKFVDTDCFFKMSHWTQRTGPAEKLIYTGDILKVIEESVYCDGKSTSTNVLVDIVSGAPGYFNETGRFVNFDSKDIKWDIVGNIFLNESLLNEVQILKWKEQNK